MSSQSDRLLIAEEAFSYIQDQLLTLYTWYHFVSLSTSSLLDCCWSSFDPLWIEEFRLSHSFWLSTATTIYWSFNFLTMLTLHYFVVSAIEKFSANLTSYLIHYFSYWIFTHGTSLHIV
ncbi:hypothetical protein RND81_10G109100 [Saponaria officinalis]|uniref:Uncharacterized protein n=1 Tax=Saponaria officinalis TaxID=3572 RepID=A0AAW1I044_SAPOF